MPLDPYELEPNSIARQFDALPEGVPGHFTYDETVRAMNIYDAEAARHQAILRAASLVQKAFERCPKAATAGDALECAGLVDVHDEWRKRIPAPDEVGMRWVIENVERSITEGTLINIPAE